MKQTRVDKVSVTWVPDIDNPEDHETRGCYAEARVSYATGPREERRLEWLTSGGLWGIGADEHNDYFLEVAEEQLGDLKQHLAHFGVDTSNWQELIEDIPLIP